MAQMTPYAYQAGETIIHRMSPGIKLLGLLAISFFSFFFGILGLCVTTATIVAAAFLAGIEARRLFAGIGPLLVTTLIVVGLRTFVGVTMENDGEAYLLRTGLPIAIDLKGLRDGLLFAWGVVVAFAGGAVLFGTTTSFQLRDAVTAAETAITRPLSRFLRNMQSKTAQQIAHRLDHSRLSLIMALTLSFIPRVFEAWEAAEDAWVARLGKKGVRGVAAIVPLVVEGLMESAAETARALESRGASFEKNYVERASNSLASKEAAAVEE